jgi:hypothetical protein
VRQSGYCIGNRNLTIDQLCNSGSYALSINSFEVAKKSILPPEISYTILGSESINVALSLQPNSPDWIPFIGNIAGGYFLNRSCPAGHFVKAIYLGSYSYYGGFNNLAALKFVCTDDSIKIGSNNVWFVSSSLIWSSRDWNNYPLNGMSIHLGDSPSPIGIRLFSDQDSTAGYWQGEGSSKGLDQICPKGHAVAGFYTYSYGIIEAISINCKRFVSESVDFMDKVTVGMNLVIPNFLKINQAYGNSGSWDVCFSNMPAAYNIQIEVAGMETISPDGCMKYSTILASKAKFVTSANISEIQLNVTCLNQLGAAFNHPSIKFHFTYSLSTTQPQDDSSASNISTTTGIVAGSVIILLFGLSLVTYVVYLRPILEKRRMASIFAKSTKSPAIPSTGEIKMNVVGGTVKSKPECNPASQLNNSIATSPSLAPEVPCKRLQLFRQLKFIPMY